jgi:hypothetical protein
MATPETTVELESRVAILEAKVERLQRELKAVVPDGRPWWQQIVGTFADDPIYEEAMRLGLKYRESLRPKPRSKQSKRAQPAKSKSRQCSEYSSEGSSHRLNDEPVPFVRRLIAENRELFDALAQC